MKPAWIGWTTTRIADETSALQWVELLRSSTGKRCHFYPVLYFVCTGLFTYKSFGLFFTSCLLIPSCHRAIHPIQDEAIVIFACLMPSLGSTNDEQKKHPPAPFKGGTFGYNSPFERSFENQSMCLFQNGRNGGRGMFLLFVICSASEQSLMKKNLSM